MCILYISIPQPPNCPSLLPHSLSSLSALLVGREMAVLVSCLEQPGVLRKPGKSNVGVQAALLYKKHRRLPTVLPRRRAEREGWDDSDSAWLPRVRGQSRESLPPSLPCPISHHDWQCQCRIRGPVSRRTRSLWLDFLRSKAQDHFFFPSALLNWLSPYPAIVHLLDMQATPASPQLKPDGAAAGEHVTIALLSRGPSHLSFPPAFLAWPALARNWPL